MNIFAWVQKVVMGLDLLWYGFWTWRTKRTVSISAGMLTGELPSE